MHSSSSEYRVLRLIVAPTAVGPVYVPFVSNPWARIILTKDTFE